MSVRHVTLWALGAGMAMAGLWGCGPSRPKTVPVTGTVTYRNAAVDGAKVMFMAPNAPPATGTTDAQGKFTLTTFENGDGAAEGSYKVSITKRQEVPDPKQPDSPYKLTKDLLPVRYSNPTQTDLTAEVKAGQPNDFKFELRD